MFFHSFKGTVQNAGSIKWLISTIGVGKKCLNNSWPPFPGQLCVTKHNRTFIWTLGPEYAEEKIFNISTTQLQTPQQSIHMNMDTHTV